MSDGSSGPRPGHGGDAATAGLDSLTDELLPALITRLRASRLGELEVAGDGWRVRLRRDASATQRSPGSASTPGTPAAGSPGDRRSVARSPGVGYFKPAPGLSIGRTVHTGDLLGSVDVLGIVLEVTSPGVGVISHVLAEAGQAVEYGQALADMDPFGNDVDAGVDASARAAD